MRGGWGGGCLGGGMSVGRSWVGILRSKAGRAIGLMELY